LADEEFVLAARKIPQIAGFDAENGARFLPGAEGVWLLLRGIQVEPQTVVHLPPIRPHKLSSRLSDVGCRHPEIPCNKIIHAQLAELFSVLGVKKAWNNELTEKPQILLA